MSDKVDSSFLAAVRAVICFITADGQYHPKERGWLQTLLDGYGFTGRERAILDQDLKSPPRLETIWNEIYRRDDRDRLLRWARGVSAVDGDVAKPEKEMLAVLEKLNARDQGSGRDQGSDLNSSYSDLAKSILELEKENRLWNDLHDFGQIMNRRYSRFGAFGTWAWALVYPERPLKLKSGSYRPFYWSVLVVLFFASALIWFPKCVSGN